MAKRNKQPFTETRIRADQPSKLTHTDIMGPFKTLTHPGHKRYIIVFVDDYSKFAKAYAIKNKSESGDCLENYLRTVRNLFGKDLKACFIRADNAKEFTGGGFSGIIEREKIDSTFSNPYKPPHNGIAERFNRTLLEKIRSLMFDSGLHKNMWNLALELAVNLYNRTPNSSIEFQTPLNVISPNSKCHIDDIRRLGSIAYAKSLSLKLNCQKRQ